jgi:hypothetical protein
MIKKEVQNSFTIDTEHQNGDAEMLTSMHDMDDMPADEDPMDDEPTDFDGFAGSKLLIIESILR